MKAKAKDPYVGIELAHKAGEVIVLEVARQHVASKLRGFPNYEAAQGV